MGKVKTRSTTEAIGYKSQDDALEAIYKEENLSMLERGYDRPDELRKVRRVVQNIRGGIQVRALIFRFNCAGTVLGYRRTKKGWMMGLLLKSGRVKEVSIDPKNWFEGDETEFVESSGIVYAIYHCGYRLVIEPITR